MGKTIALANQKGGVGKTTTAVNVACYLAAVGVHVLLVDLDPQGNATSSIGIDKSSLPASVYDVLVNDVETDATIIQDVRTNLDVLGANKELAGAEIELQNMTRPQRRLESALAPLRDRYDVILVDCPPSLGLLAINGLTAADLILVPVQCEYLALEGLAQVNETIEFVRRSLNPNLDILGLVMTMFDSRTRLAVDVVKDVHRLYPRRIFRSLIPRSVRIAEAPSYGQSIFEYDSSSRGAEAYLLLGSEITERLGLDTRELVASEQPSAVRG